MRGSIHTQLWVGYSESSIDDGIVLNNLYLHGIMISSWVWQSYYLHSHMCDVVQAVRWTVPTASQIRPGGYQEGRGLCYRARDTVLNKWSVPHFLNIKSYSNMTINNKSASWWLNSCFLSVSVNAVISQKGKVEYKLTNFTVIGNTL